MALADEHLAEIGRADFDAWDHERAARLVDWAKALPGSTRNDALREARLLSAASDPVVHFMISLPSTGMPGVDFARPVSFSPAGWQVRRAMPSSTVREPQAPLVARLAEEQVAAPEGDPARPPRRRRLGVRAWAAPRYPR